MPRKYYLDYVRVFCVLLLFPYHTFMIYNSWGEKFYITGVPLKGTSWFCYMVYPWWMALLFTIAGISAAYALKKRGSRAFVKERVLKLILPLLVGLVVVIPIQSYIADIFHNGYTGTYFEHYPIFFTRITDLTGGDGGFTPAHLWFMLYLFIISIIMLPIMNAYSKSKKKIDGAKVTLVKLMPLFVVIMIMTPLLEIGGKSGGEALACFGIGFFLLSLDEVQERLEKNVFLLALIFLVALILHGAMIAIDQASGLMWDIEYRIVLWFGILALLGLSKKYLNTANKLMNYLSQAAFPMYYFHQSILVVVGYYILKTVKSTGSQIVLIITLSFGMSLIAYEVFRRFKFTAIAFGIKHKTYKDPKKV